MQYCKYICLEIFVIMRTIKVIHLEINGEHYYFGSKKALCDNFGKECLGITYNSLKNIKITPESPFRNKCCVIREGILLHTSVEKKIVE